jgi:membrane protease YdiL (CAAX protease family)
LLARILERLRRHPLIVFFVLAYAITWPGWWLEVAGSQLGALLGYFGPAIAAILVASIAGGRERLGELLARLFRWRVPFRWVLVAVLLPPGSALVALAIPILAGNATYRAEPGLLASLLPELGLVLLFGSLYGVVVAAGEELGWRGYALPKLLQRHNALVASILVGIFWGLWHLPISYLFGGGSPPLVDSLLYGLGIDSASVIYTWIFRHTRGSVLIACLFHSVYDVSLIVAGQIAPVALGLEFPFRLHMLVLAATAALIVVVAGTELSRTSAQGRSPRFDFLGLCC